MHEDAEIARLFHQLSVSIAKHSLPTVAQKMGEVLEELDSQKLESGDRLVFDYILHLISDEYDVTKEDLIYSKNRGTVVIARKMCFVLMEHNVGFSQAKVAKFFNYRSRQTVSRSIIEYRQMLDDQERNKLNQEEREFIETFNRFDPVVKEFKQKHG